MVNATSLIIVFGMVNILLYFALTWKNKKKTEFMHVLSAFLSGLIPYGILASFYSGFVGKQFLVAGAETCFDDNYRVMLMAAGLSFSWLYYHIFFKRIRK